MRPAVLRLARVAHPDLDKFIHDTRPPVVHDSELVVLSAAGTDSRPIGTLVNWANHPETLGSKNTLITADYPGYLYKHLEKRLGGVAALWNGAIGGMQSPLGAIEVSFEGAEKIGRRVADLARHRFRGADVHEDRVEPGRLVDGLRALSARLGVRLVHRTTRRLSLTETGRAYYERAVSILAELEEADQAANIWCTSVTRRFR